MHQQSLSQAQAPLVYEAIAADLRSNGIEAAFGLMSDDTALLINAMEAVGIRFYAARHENNALAMAEGYAASGRRLGVAIIGRGPGAANCVNALVHVGRTGAKVLVICGDAPTRPAPRPIGPDYKGFDTVRLFAATGTTTFVATSPELARGALADAIAAAATGRAVSLHLPVDVQARPLMQDAPPAVRPAQDVSAPDPRHAAIAAAAALLAKSRSPIILAGYGAYLSGAKESIEQLADHSGALLITTLRAKDLFLGHPFEIGVAGSFSNSVARRLVSRADCVLVVGAGLNLLTTSLGDFFPAGPVIQIDLNGERIGRYYDADLAIVGDARTSVDQILASLPDRPAGDRPFRTEEVRELIANFSHAQDFQEAHTDWTADPRALALALDQKLPKSRDVIYDMGNFFAIAPYVSVPDPGALRYTGDFGSIGLGFGTALGVAAAGRGRPTVLFIGDGSLFMTLGELETVAREDLPLIIIVMNDNAYGAERHYLGLRDQPFGKAVFPAFDFAPIAEQFGVEAYTIRSLQDLEGIEGTLAAANGPLLLDCKINPAIPAGFLSEFAMLEGHG